jgi:mRNA interferase MazF
MEITRGDIVIVAARGTYTGKPRPALIVQSDAFNSTHASITLCPMTSEVIDAALFRVSVPPGERTGLDGPSQIMIDKVVSVPRAAIGKRIGTCNDDELLAVNDALHGWFGL